MAETPSDTNLIESELGIFAYILSWSYLIYLFESWNPVLKNELNSIWGGGGGGEAKREIEGLFALHILNFV